MDKNGLIKDTTPPVNLERINAFIVDDDENVLEFMTTLLKDSGANVESYGVPEKALEGFKDKYGCVDLVFADHLMPHLNGNALIQEMREIKPELNFIIATGLCDQEKVETLGEEGAHVIAKSFHIHDFIDALKRCLDK
ncbi:MAG: response regulator [Lentisphaerales bacterium]|nr:response regulator [Lentisphaerales bacterium]